VRSGQSTPERLAAQARVPAALALVSGAAPPTGAEISVTATEERFSLASPRFTVFDVITVPSPSVRLRTTLVEAPSVVMAIFSPVPSLSARFCSMPMWPELAYVKLSVFVVPVASDGMIASPATLIVFIMFVLEIQYNMFSGDLITAKFRELTPSLLS
jgi:hypothetical protein